MHDLTRLLLALGLCLPLTLGCEETAVDGVGALAPRCAPEPCTDPPVSNTSRIGDHALTNMAATIGADASNTTTSVRISGGVGRLRGRSFAITEIDVEADGELRLKLGGAGWISGEAVKDARLNVVVTPLDPLKPIQNGTLLLADARCEPGLTAPAMTICRYQFLTDIATDDPDYPPSTRLPNYFHTCPDLDADGPSGHQERYDSVLSPQVALHSPEGETPRIDLAPGQFIVGCLNGAVSKGQYRLNAFYDPTAERGLAESQRTAMLLMWMAWFDGASRTEPGQMISPHDPVGGLFSWTDDPSWGIEAGYGSTGAQCRGGSLMQGLHRLIADPVAELAGWSALPHCDAADLTSHATLGVKVGM